MLALRYVGVVDRLGNMYMKSYCLLHYHGALPVILLISGLPPHPGPTLTADPLTFNILVQNLTSLTTQYEAFLELFRDVEAKISFVQELSIPKPELADQHQIIRDAGLKARLTCPDPELSHTTAAVGVIYQ